MASSPSAQRPDRAPLVESWLTGIRILHIAHGIASDRYARFTRATGVLVAVCAAAAGAALTVVAHRGGSERLMYCIAALTLIVSALGVAQTAFNYPELSAKHRQAFVAYGALRRQLEIHISGERSGRGGADLERVSETWGEIEKTSPRVGRILRFTARRELASLERRRSRKGAGRRLPFQRTPREAKESRERVPVEAKGKSGD